MPLYDAHNHLQFVELTPFLERIVRDLAAIHLAGAVVNGTHPDDDWDAVSTLAARLPWVRPSYGIHPWDCGLRPTDWRERFTARLAAEPAAAVGEIGLDGLILEPERELDFVPAPLDEQQEVFAFQLRRAAEHDRPASVHCVRAWGALQEVLRAIAPPRRGWLLHAYGGSPDLVPGFAAQGAYFSFNPSHIDPRRTRQREAFRRVPLDRLLVETDAPAFLPPDPAWHLPEAALNHPANLTVAYAGLAALRGLTPAALEAIVAQNFTRLFG